MITPKNKFRDEEGLNVSEKDYATSAQMVVITQLKSRLLNLNESLVLL